MAMLTDTSAIFSHTVQADSIERSRLLQSEKRFADWKHWGMYDGVRHPVISNS
jgi:hypothetical protein